MQRTENRQEGERLRPCDCGCGQLVKVKATEEAAKVYQMACLMAEMAEARARQR